MAAQLATDPDDSSTSQVNSLAEFEHPVRAGALWAELSHRYGNIPVTTSCRQCRIFRGDAKPKLEIRPGLGSVDRRIDRPVQGRSPPSRRTGRLCQYLRNHVDGVWKLIRSGIAVSNYWAAFMTPGRRALARCSQLPYSISTPILERLVRIASTSRDADGYFPHFAA